MFFNSLTVSIAVFCATCWLLIIWKRIHKLPPGPWGLPFFGYYPFFTRKPYLDFYRLGKHYGHVISFRTIGGSLVVVLNGAEAIKDILVNRAEEFLGKPEHNLLAWISDGLGIGQEEGRAWKEHRQFFLKTAKCFGFGKQESEVLVHEEIKILISDLKREEGKSVDMRFHIAYAVNSVACPILFSKKFKKDGSLFKEIVIAGMRLAEMFQDKRYLLVGHILEHFVMKLFPSTKKIRKAKDLFRRIIKEIIDEHVKTFDPDHPRDFIDGYLYQAKKLDRIGEENSFTMDRLLAISFNLLLEVTETVGFTICGLLHTASQYPDEQKLVQEELDSVVGQERLPSWMDRQKLPYVEAFIQELYRHNMPFNISTLYSNYKETTIQGYRIPPDSIVIANQWSINNDPALYPEPSKFNPKRFIDENGRKIKTEGPYVFGIGKRACIGESLAQMEVFLLMAALLQNFTLYPADQTGFLKTIPRK